MDHSRMMALLVAGSMICGGFAASAADEAKKAETAKPAEAAKAAETVKPAETKPEDLFAVVPAVVAEVKGEKITKDMLVAEVMKMFPNGKIPEGVTADTLKAALPRPASSRPPKWSRKKSAKSSRRWTSRCSP